MTKIGYVICVRVFLWTNRAQKWVLHTQKYTKNRINITKILQRNYARNLKICANLLIYFNIITECKSSVALFKIKVPPVLMPMFTGIEYISEKSGGTF